MYAEAWCCRDDKEYIRRGTGTTIGDVVDAARRICAEHEDGNSDEDDESNFNDE